MERELGYYWINDGDENYIVAEYIGSNTWAICGCSLKFTTDPKWEIGNKIEM